MKHFKKHKCLNYRYMIAGYTEYRLYPYDIKRGLKYRLCRAWYNPEQGFTQIKDCCLVATIKAAEKIVNGGINNE